MRKLLKIWTLFILAALVISCGEDFLDRPLQGELTQENFPTTAGDALLATNAVYNTLREWFYHSGGFPILDIMSDDAHKGSNPSDAATTVGPYESFTHTTNQDGLARWWNTLYEGIKRANVVIELVPGIEMDAGLRNRYVAEARFLRGLYYFDLVRAWGAVPIVTSTTPPQRISRSPENEVYELIIGDLEFAINNLPEKTAYGPAELGRGTSGAANALLARVYLFRGDFANAETHALEVINSGLYALDPDFIRTHSVEGEHNEESVFEISAVPLENLTNGGNQWGNVQGVRGTPNRGWGFNRPSLDLINSFEEGDTRLEGTVIFLGDVIDGVQIIGDSQTPDQTRDENGNLIEIETYNRKVWMPGNRTQEQWGHNRRLIRYADVLLMAAEAAAERGDVATARQYLNQVRERARGDNPEAVPDITESNSQRLVDLIIEERRLELALEGHRFWDLVRTGRAETVLGPRGFVSGQHELFPIPQTEIDLSEGSLDQNPNW